MKCGKLGCPCATEATARHGPYFGVTRAIKGQTVSRYVSPQQAVIVRRQIAAAQAFRKEVAAVWAACEAWADEELDAAAPARPKGGEKGGLQAAIAAEAAAEITVLIGDGEGLAPLELAVRRQALAVAARVLDRLLNAVRSDHVGPVLACPCGASARYAGRRTKRIVMAVGPLVLARVYDHCPTCGQGCPAAASGACPPASPSRKAAACGREL